MSYENVPKNLTEKAVLTRQGRPDYSILSSDPLPSPTADEAGAILRVTDTGKKYTWTGTNWLLIAVEGCTRVSTQSTEHVPVSAHVLSAPSASTTFAVATALGDRAITVASSVGFLVGDRVRIGASALERHLPQITGIAANVITIDRPLDIPHTIGETIAARSLNLAVSGSAASPVIYTTGPLPGETWYLTRLIVAMTHGGMGDLGLFGDLSPLINGFLGRLKLGGLLVSYLNWKTNADLSSTMYDVSFDVRSGGGGTYGTTGRFTFEKLGATVRLDGDLGDRVEFWVQDDLTGLDSLEINMQGHISENRIT